MMSDLVKAAGMLFERRLQIIDNQQLLNVERGKLARLQAAVAAKATAIRKCEQATGRLRAMTEKIEATLDEAVV